MRHVYYCARITAAYSNPNTRLRILPSTSSNLWLPSSRLNVKIRSVSCKPAMFSFKWLRRFVRRHTNPMPVDRAASVKHKLSLIYMLLAWNAFGVVCYMIYTGRGDWAKHYGYKSEADSVLPPAEQWARTLKVDKAKIVQMSGLHREGVYDYQNEGRRETSNPEEENH